MTQIILAQSVDTEIAKHCAYSLPAVAYTLGRGNWNCLRDTYETLASDMQVSQASYSCFLADVMVIKGDHEIN